MRRWFVATGIAALLAHPSAGAAQMPADPTQEYAAVQRSFLQEDFNAVAMLGKTFLLRHPAAPEALRIALWRALSLDRLSQAGVAIQELEVLEARLAPQQPLWAEVVYWRADICRRAGRMEAAKVALTRLQELAPASAWVPHGQIGLGLLYLQLQAYEIARRYFREVAQEWPEAEVALEARVYEGLCQLKLKRYGEAVQLLEPLLDRLGPGPTKAQAVFYLGEGLTGLGRFAEAARAYQQAMELGRASAWSRHAQFALGWAQYGAGRCDESVRTLERYLQDADAQHRAEAFFARASCLMRLGREEQAIAQFEELIARSAAHPLAYEAVLALAEAHTRRKQPGRAQALLEQFLRQPLEEPVRHRVVLFLGAVALEHGDADAATAAFASLRGAADLAVRQAALNGLGDASLHLGRPEEAKRSFEASLQLSATTPAGGMAAYHLGRLALQQGEVEKAISLFGGLSGRSDVALADDASLALAVALMQQGRPEQARGRLEQLRRQRPGTVAAARAAYYLALLRAGQDGHEAETLAQETVAQAPHSEEAAGALVLLADLRIGQASLSEGRAWLARTYRAGQFTRRQRAALAKRLGEYARADRAYAEAIEWFAQAQQLLPSLAGEAAYRMASCYEEAGDVEVALQAYQVIAQAPWAVRGRLAAAKLLERQGRAGEAEAIYAALAQAGVPESKVVQERLAILKARSAHTVQAR
ncbi:MAG: tetratricopeptide repeat protein [Candidatus Omnitrophica bacterium]|nr:tetratricopeptide repeat protein [Candidatus Omnitrophota bacterium]